MNATECRIGGRHLARERGAFDAPDEETPRVEPVEPAELLPELPVFGFSVPMFNLGDIVRWSRCQRRVRNSTG